jgi:hypothetical protein
MFTMPDEKTPRHIHTDWSAKADYISCKEILIGSKNNAETTCMDRSAKADYIASIAIFCGGLYDAETICKVLIEEDLMDLVYESSFVKQLIQQGIEEGIQQGIEQRERGYAIKNIITVLEIRFDLHESENLSARLATITDLQRLKQLLRSAVQVSSLEAFEQALDA